MFKVVKQRWDGDETILTTADEGHARRVAKAETRRSDINCKVVPLSLPTNLKTLHRVGRQILPEAEDVMRLHRALNG